MTWPWVAQSPPAMHPVHVLLSACPRRKRSGRRRASPLLARPGRAFQARDQRPEHKGWHTQEYGASGRQHLAQGSVGRRHRYRCPSECGCCCDEADAREVGGVTGSVEHCCKPPKAKPTRQHILSHELQLRRACAGKQGQAAALPCARRHAEQTSVCCRYRSSRESRPSRRGTLSGLTQLVA